MISDVEYIFNTCLLFLCFLLRNFYLIPLPIFLIDIFGFLPLSCMSSLYSKSSHTHTHNGNYIEVTMFFYVDYGD